MLASMQGQHGCLELCIQRAVLDHDGAIVFLELSRLVLEELDLALSLGSLPGELRQTAPAHSRLSIFPAHLRRPLMASSPCPPRAQSSDLRVNQGGRGGTVTAQDKKARLYLSLVV
jgi:hypothetical protein